MIMKRILLASLILAISIMAHSQTKIQLAVDGRTATATLVDNVATRALAALLADGPIEINMSDYGGFEKVGALPQSLPTSNSQISTVPGDIMLYQGNQMVIFYGANSWSYTRLGKIDDATVESVRQFLGSGSVSLTISLQPAGIDSPTTEASAMAYDLGGRHVEARPLPPGVYIINGQKTLIK